RCTRLPLETQGCEGQLLEGLLDKRVHSPLFKEVLQARLLPIRPIAMLDEHPEHGSGHGDRLVGTEEQPRASAEIAVPGDASELDTKIDARWNCAAFWHADGEEADVVGIDGGRDRSTAVERDVELARQAVEVAVIQDVVVQRPRVGTDVDQLVTIKSRCRRGGDVPDVVCTRTARRQTEFLHARQNIDDVAGPK